MIDKAEARNTVLARYPHLRIPSRMGTIKIVHSENARARKVRFKKIREKRIVDVSKLYGVAKWRYMYPERDKAHKKVFAAVRNGSLKKGVCYCGNTLVEAHHEDYSKPLEITWLCKKHHIEADKSRKLKSVDN